MPKLKTHSGSKKRFNLTKTHLCRELCIKDGLLR